MVASGRSCTLQIGNLEGPGKVHLQLCFKIDLITTYSAFANLPLCPHDLPCIHR